MRHRFEQVRHRNAREPPPSLVGAGTLSRVISRYGVKTDIDAPGVRRSDWRSVIRHHVRNVLPYAGNVGLCCANPTYRTASVK